MINIKSSREELNARALFEQMGSFEELFDKDGFVWNALLQIDRFFSKKYRSEQGIEKLCFVENEEHIFVGRNCKIEKGSYIKGPCYIGDNCEIRTGAYLRGNVIIGNNCVVGHGSELKNAILLNEAHCGHFNYVGDSILGNGVNLGAGVKLANLRLDRQNVRVSFRGEKIDSGLKKFGAILGDGVQIGCNAVLNPGTIVAKGGIIMPLSNVGGYVEVVSSSV